VCVYNSAIFARYFANAWDSECRSICRRGGRFLYDLSRYVTNKNMSREIRQLSFEQSVDRSMAGIWCFNKY